MKLLPFACSLVIVIAACGGGGKDCVDLCTEAQAGSCTSIQGNCGSFCAALDTVEGPAGCGAQREAYETCLNRGPLVCDNSCSGQENALSSCVGTYCLAHASDPSCQTLAASF